MLLVEDRVCTKSDSDSPFGQGAVPESKMSKALEAVQSGGMFVVVERLQGKGAHGYLAVAADAVTPDCINFMATNGRGLICLALTRSIQTRLGLPDRQSERDRLGAKRFTPSIEAAVGVSTGISAHDRATTIAVAVAQSSDHASIISPGHVFPVIVDDCGVLVHAHGPDAAVDMSRLAGRGGAAVICDILNDDGDVASLVQLRELAFKWGLLVVSVDDVRKARLATLSLSQLTAERGRAD